MKMNSNHAWIACLLLSIGLTFLTTKAYIYQQTVKEVVDNITYFCYNNRSGAVIEGSNGVYILCQGVKIEQPPQQPYDRSKEA